MVKSGLDMISELLKEVKFLRKEMKVLDQNVKRIANSAKIAEIAEKVVNTPFKDWAQRKPKSRIEAVVPSEASIKQKNLRFTFETSDGSKTKQEAANRSTRTSPTACMCEGKMVASYDGKSVSLPGLNVKIFDDKDVLKKETKTNRAGMWMAKLSPGNYVVHISGNFQNKPLYDVNLTFKVKPGMKRLEVK